MYAITNVTGAARILKTGPSAVYGFNITNAITSAVTICFSDSALATVTGEVHYFQVCPTRGRVSSGLSVEFFRPLRFITGLRAKLMDYASGATCLTRFG